MSGKEDEEQPPEKPFYIERAKTGRAGCKKCKQKIGQGELRFAKLGHNPFGSGTIKLWHHIPCIFEVFRSQRATTKKIETQDDIAGWEELGEVDKNIIISYLPPDLKKVFEVSTIKQSSSKTKTDLEILSQNAGIGANLKDDSFRAFRKLCSDLSNDSSYLSKTKIISEFFDKGSDGKFFKGDIELWCKLLLPGTITRVYNLQSKQLVKLFSRIFDIDQEEMLEDLEKGDVAETVAYFFEKSKVIRPCSKSTLTLQDVDRFLEVLSKLSKEDEQSYHFKQITKKCTSNDLKIILRLVKRDLRIKAGPKHILKALHKDAYKAFQTCRDLKTVIANALKAKENSKTESKEINDVKGMSIGITVMTPILPMLAQACKSVQMAFKKFPSGMFSEIKYDGERVQLHKHGDIFKYFSRSLKPVLPHKVANFKDYIPQAFPHGKDLVLDAEILMVKKATGKPLPFGTLGIHKKNEFKDANVCLFVFDCMHYNGQSLLETAIKERREILRKNMVEIENHVMLSEMEEIHKVDELEKMITKVFKLGLEGLVLKDLNSTYEPGKRHWLKIKKDYLFSGAIADAADLVVLGAWLGTGAKGGIMSSFLMGCYDQSSKKWLTVTKVSNGHDDNTLEKIQKELDVVKINKDPSKVPKWLKCTHTMIPDFVAVDPKKMPVWEITGAEFTCNKVHTAGGISIRFPRVTKIRSDKDWMTATSLEELKKLYIRSKETSEFNLNGMRKKSPGMGSSDEEDSCKVRKRRRDSLEKQDFKKAKKTDFAVRHDDANTNTETQSENAEEFSSSNITNPLPCIFTDCIIQFPKNNRHYDFLRRYIIAYGGTLYDKEKDSLESSGLEVTHVVHLSRAAEMRKEKFWAKDVRHVHINWIWGSIKLLEKQSEYKYRVLAKKEK